MGSTLTAMTTASGFAYTNVLAIEGYETLITNGSTSAVVTAWAGTDWSAAQGGLQISGSVEQKLEAWEASPQVTKMTFGVMPSANTAAGDALGRLMFGRNTGTETYLATALDVNDTSVVGLRADDFGASGNIHIGCENIAYSSRDTGTDTFTVSGRGKYSPFLTESSANFGRNHRLPLIADGVSIAPKITSKQREWRGRWVGLWAHREVGGVLDVKAQAQLVWAGRIVGFRDDPSGMTLIDCEDVRAAFNDCVLMRDQFTCRIQDGIYLQAGWHFTAVDVKSGTTKTANSFDIVSSGAAGDNEANAGVYTRSEIVDLINNWLGAEYSAGTPRLNFQWTLSEIANYRMKFTWSVGAAAGNLTSFGAPNAVLNFFGWPQPGHDDDMGSVDGLWLTATDGTAIAPEMAYRTYMSGGAGGASIDIENVRGTWWNNYSPSDLWPSALGTQTASVAVLQLNGGPLAVFGYTDADTIVCLGGAPFLDELSGVPWDESINFRRMRADQEGDFNLRQVAVIKTRFKWFMTMTACSTGVANFNYTDTSSHGDNLPAQLSACIPWGLLGTNWLADIAALDENFSPLLVVIDKPTKWTEVMGVEMVARMLTMVWQNGGLRIRTWGTPTSAHSSHTFTEQNKAALVSDRDINVTVGEMTDDWLINTVKLRYNRYLNGDYRDTITIFDAASQDDHGSKPVELSMRNTFGGYYASGNAIAEIADDLALTLPVFSRPLYVIRRTISMPFYENCAPGQFCLVNDNHARDPATGIRGLSSKPGLIVRHRVDWGGYEIDTGEVRPPSAEIDILLLPISNISIYSPCAEVDYSQANAGYNAGTKVLTCHAHVHSESSEAADAANFVAGDKVYVVECDPDDPTAFLSWSDTVASQTGNTITLTTGLAGWDSTKYYRVVSDVYTTAVASQQSDTYIADDADGMVLNTVGAYAYGNDPGQATTWTAETANSFDDTYMARLYAQTAYVEGRPLHTGDEMDLARLVNQMVNVRSVSGQSSLTSGSAKAYTGTGRKILDVIPVHFGPGDLVMGDRRVYVTAWARSSDGTSTLVYVNLCRRPPIGTSWESTDTTSPDYSMVGPYEQDVSSAITSTTWGEYTFELSLKSVDPYTGEGFIVVEVDPKCEYRGLSQIWLGGYQEVA